MFFGKKKDAGLKCISCGSRTSKGFNFCPVCGSSLVDSEKYKKDYGLLGDNDGGDSFIAEDSGGFGITDKLINSIFSSMMKSLDKQFKNQISDANKNTGSDIVTFPNGVSIKISSGQVQNKPAAKKKKKARIVEDGQIKRMNSLPKMKAKGEVKRIGDKIFYELSTPGVVSLEDVFVSKLESGYEVKAIGSKKVYVNSVPINLPMKSYSVLKNKLLLEFVSNSPGEF